MKNFKNVEFIIYGGLVFGIFFVLYILKFEIKIEKVPTGIPGSAPVEHLIKEARSILLSSLVGF